jgi:dUTP pyrophosphatase
MDIFDVKLPPLLKFKKKHENAVIPSYATDGAVCFDFYACLHPFKSIYLVDEGNEVVELKLQYDYMILEPNERYLIPTGICADIPEGYCIKIYSRSGLSFKAGIMLTNGVGVVDSDFVDEIMISVTNFGPDAIEIASGERVAQGEFAPFIRPRIEEIFHDLDKKGNRQGGFGSTGE